MREGSIRRQLYWDIVLMGDGSIRDGFIPWEMVLFLWRWVYSLGDGSIP